MSCLLLGLIVLTTLVAYSPVMFNFFAGDDFVHLSWLSQAVQHPELVVRNFYTSWLDGTTTRFYRPLISVFMFTDYLLWGVNGLGFRVTNLLFHLTSTVFIFFIVRELAYGKEKNESSLWWPALAASIFALYPLHPEAVSWITGRVDSVVGTFCLAALWFYIKWRHNENGLCLAGALISLVLGLLSKEMAITLPAIFLCYEFFFRQAAQSSASSTRFARLCHTLFSMIKPTLPFFAVLAGYFIVRRLALGTFVGGYDNSLFFIANPQEFILSWLHALKMLLVPINKNLLGSHSLLTKAWEVELGTIAVLGAVGLYANKRSRPAILFTLFWLFLSLAPVYKIFAIADDLQGSRLAYLATAPLSILLAAGFSLLNGTAIKSLQRILGCLFIALSAVLLFINNQPWKQAGEENNAIRLGLAQLYAQLPGDPQVLLIGLPDQIDGAYTCRNSLDGMSRRPQLDRDIKNSLMINPFEPIFPFGFLKNSIVQNQNNIRIFRWDNTAKQFAPVPIPQTTDNEKTVTWSGPLLRTVLKAPADMKESHTWNEDGSLSVSTGKAPCYLEFSPGRRNCWTTGFITVNLTRVMKSTTPAGADLLYATDLNPDFELKRRVHADCQPVSSDQNLIFALHGLPDWTFGGNFDKLKLLLPAQSELRINSVALTNPEEIMPTLTFANSGYLGSKGYFHLDPKEPKRDLQVDCSRIPTAKSIELEITRTNLLFNEQNCQHQSSVIMERRNSAKTKDAFTLKLEEFPMSGIYELRAWAKDATGKLCGVSSDHLVISVDGR